MARRFVNRRTGTGFAVALALAVAGLGFFVGSRQGPSFTHDGRLELPADFRTWVFAGSSLGLGYREPEAGSGLGMFHTVLIHPAAYERYVRSGEFPEGTMLALLMYERAEKAPPSERGYFEGRFVGLEIALKDTRRFQERWGYFNFTGPEGALRQTASRIDPAAGCNGCHARHGAVDNVFVQFYPSLRPYGQLAGEE